MTALERLFRGEPSSTVVVWDFNGTLLNDLESCLDSLNVILRQRGMAPLALPEYRRRFLFPVSDFYKGLGIDPDREPHWDAVAESFHLRYLFSRKLALQPGAAEAVAHFRALGVRQGVLSALEQGILEVQLRQFGLLRYMDFVMGSRGYYGSSKADAARTLGLDGHIVMIGDTLHDAEVAASMGWHCLLCAAGHQDASRLASGSVPVIGSLTGLAHL